MRRFWSASTLLKLAALAIYLLAAPAHVVDGDNGEFAALGALGGVAHPSGYPLYVIYLGLAAWLPGTPAHAAALGTALLGGACIWVLHAAARAWGARSAAASLAVAIVAASPIVLRVHSEAEVFALNSLVAATVLLLAAENGPLRGVQRALALGIVAGLGLSDHLSCALLAPIGIYGVVRAVRESSPRAPSRRWRSLFGIAAAAAGFVVGLLPYVYLLVAPATLSWGPIGAGNLLHHALRLDYGGPGAFAPHGKPVPAVDNLVLFATTFGRAWLWVPIAAALYAFARNLKRPAWICLAASLVLAGPLVSLRFDVPLTSAGTFVVQRFYLLPIVVFAVPVAIGIEALLARVEVRPLIAEGIAVVVLLLGAGLSAGYVARGHTPAVERFAHNEVLGLPPDAVVITANNDGLGYVQKVLGEREDVAIIMWPMLPVGTYRHRLVASLGLDIPEHGDSQLSIHVAEQLLAKRPLFVDGVEANILSTFPSVPVGVLYHVLPRGSVLPPIQQVLADNRALFERFTLDYPVPHESDDYAAEVHRTYARTWWIIATALRRGGDPAAAEAEALAHALEPVP